MRAFLERVTATVSAHEMLTPEQRVLVAFSGGVDSTVLLHVLHHLGYEVHAGHVQHGLRGEEAETDAAHAATFVASLSVPYSERRVEVGAYASEHKLSLEAAARELRYAALEEMAQEVGAERIATGHTADDQAETVLLKLLRGAGPAGLSGMPPVRGRIIRPLLFLTRAEVEDCARAEGLSYRIDSSNEDPRFTRNRVRHEVLPVLSKIQPKVVDSLSRLATIMREENVLISSLVEQLMGTVVVWGEGQAQILLHDLSSLPVALQRRLLRSVVAKVRSRETDIEFGRIEAVVELAVQGRTGAVVEFPEGVRVERGYGELVVSRGGEKGVALGEWTLSVPGALRLAEFGVEVHAEESADTTIVRDSKHAVLDRELLVTPLTVRTWREGDRFAPLGVKGEMKLHDFFVNTKVPRAERRRVLLVESAGEIVWVVGRRISERYKVTANTRRTIRLRVEQL